MTFVVFSPLWVPPARFRIRKCSSVGQPVPRKDWRGENGSVIRPRNEHERCAPFLSLPDEGYEILSNLPESVVYACRPCCGSDKTKWREVLNSELRKGLRQVLQGLLSSKCVAPLMQCAQVWFLEHCVGPFLLYFLSFPNPI